MAPALHSTRRLMRKLPNTAPAVPTQGSIEGCPATSTRPPASAGSLPAGITGGRRAAGRNAASAWPAGRAHPVFFFCFLRRGLDGGSQRGRRIASPVQASPCNCCRGRRRRGSFQRARPPCADTGNDLRVAVDEGFAAGADMGLISLHADADQRLLQSPSADSLHQPAIRHSSVGAGWRSAECALPPAARTLARSTTPGAYKNIRGSRRRRPGPPCARLPNNRFAARRRRTRRRGGMQVPPQRVPRSL